MQRRTIVLALVAILVTISGCAQIESTATIGENGEFEHYEMDVQFSDDAWELIVSIAESEGYDSVEQYLLDDSEDDDGEESAIECVEGAEEISVDEDQQSVHLECTDPVIRNESLVNITAEDDGISYQDAETAAWDQNLNGTEDMGLNVDEMEFTFTLVFPSEVTSSNADVVDGNQATWHLTDWEGGALEAHTGSASGTTGDDDGDTTDDSGDDSTDDSGDDSTDDSGDDSTDDGTDSSDGGGAADDSGTDGSGDGSSETDGEDGEASVDEEDGESEDSDGSGPSGFTLAGVLVALAALVGVGLRRSH